MMRSVASLPSPSPPNGFSFGGEGWGEGGSGSFDYRTAPPHPTLSPDQERVGGEGFRHVTRVRRDAAAAGCEAMMRSVVSLPSPSPPNGFSFGGEGWGEGGSGSFDYRTASPHPTLSPDQERVGGEGFEPAERM